MTPIVEELVQHGALTTPRIIRAFAHIDRRDFVLPSARELAYSDIPLDIGEGQTISQPTTVAFMLEQLQPGPGMRILDVGSGSGWTTAMLAQIVGPTGEVHGVEINPALVQYGRVNLGKYDLPWAWIHQAMQDVLGYPGGAPYDRILVSAASTHLQMQLVHQLKLGGVMVVPVGDAIWRVERTIDGRMVRTKFLGYRFVPLHVASPRASALEA